VLVELGEAFRGVVALTDLSWKFAIVVFGKRALIGESPSSEAH
jgi:hypothetical protein